MKRTLMFIALGLVMIGISLDSYLIINSYVSPVKSLKFSPIVRLSLGERGTFCSGTVISRTTILTAAHCVIEASIFGQDIVRKDIEIRPPDNTPVHVIANVHAIRGQMDQAVLIGDFSKFQIAPYISDPRSLTDPKVKGAKLLACGYPFGGPLFCTRLYFKETIGFYWKVNGSLIPGMSGGPVMLEDGSVVATNDAVEGAFSVVSPIYNIDLDIPNGK